MRYLLRRTYNKDIREYKDELSDFNMLYIHVKDYCDEEHVLSIIEIRNIEELNRLSDAVGSIVIKNITWELDHIDYELDKDITKIIEIYDNYRE
ncbi:hypothetical protein UT300012_32940 [Paraclostridium bifermentans]